MRGFTLPCIMALLPNKKRSTYVQMLDMINDAVVSWDEHRVLLDYEAVAWQAFQEKGFEVAGCFFHFRKATYAKVQWLGLAGKYQADYDFRLRVASLAALSFLPPEDVPGAFDTLAAEQFTDPEEAPLVEYFAKTWVGERRQRSRGRNPPLFAIDLWSTHTRVIEDMMLTTNAAELFHRHHRVQFSQGQHPGMQRFIDNVKAQFRITLNDLSKVDLGQTKDTKSDVHERNGRVRALLGDYQGRKNAGDSTTRVVVKAIAKVLMADAV